MVNPRNEGGKTGMMRMERGEVLYVTRHNKFVVENSTDIDASAR